MWPGPSPTWLVSRARARMSAMPPSACGSGWSGEPYGATQPAGPGPGRAHLPGRARRSRARGPAGDLRARRGAGRDQGGHAARDRARMRRQPGQPACAGTCARPLADPPAPSARRRADRGRLPRWHPAGLPRRPRVAGRAGRPRPGPPVRPVAAGPRRSAPALCAFGVDGGVTGRHRVRRARGRRDRCRPRRARLGDRFGRSLRHRRCRSPRCAGRRSRHHRGPGLRRRLPLPGRPRGPVRGRHRAGSGDQRVAAGPGIPPGCGSLPATGPSPR